MRIEQPGGGGGMPGVRRPGRGGFRLPAETASQPGAVAPTPAPAAVPPPASFAGGDAARRDAEAERQALGLLEALSALQLALLEGRADAATLERLLRLTEGAPAADPRLAAVLAALALRARVEIARRDGGTGATAP